MTLFLPPTTITGEIAQLWLPRTLYEDKLVSTYVACDHLNLLIRTNRVFGLMDTNCTAKIGFTGDKEKIMQISWSSPNPASVYLFRDLTMEFVDLLSSQNMLKLQTNPMPALTAPIELKDFLEEQLKPVELMDPDEALVKLSAANAENQGIPQDKRALAEHVVFEEDDEDGSHVFRVVCRLNKDAKTAYAISVLSNVANGLDCTSFAITKTNVSATVKVVMRTGTLLDLVMTVGLNESKHRILHGTYPESQAAYGRQFWIRFAESLAKLGLLFGQTISPSVIPTPVPASAQTANSSLPQFVQKEEDLADDSGLEYDSSDYDEDAKSEASVDSDSD